MSELVCWYCGRVLKTKGTRKNRPTVDHQLPSSRGGSDSKSNKVWACNDCNHDKNNLTVEEYRVVISYREGLIPEYLNLVKFHGEK